MSEYFVCQFRNLLLASITSGLFACSSPEQTNEFTGYVEAELIYIAAPQSGWLTEQSWHSGQQVETNQALFSLDDSLQLAQVNQAQALLTQAKAQERNTFTGARQEELAELTAQEQAAQVAVNLAKSEQLRWTQIVAKGLAPESKATEVNANYASSVAKLQNIQASIEVAKLGARQEVINSADAAQQAAQASLEQAQWQLSQRQILATINGQIEEVFYRKGEFVQAGKPVLAILPDDALIIRFFVPEPQLADFKLGQSLQITADGFTQPITASLFHINRTAEFTPPVIYDQQTRKKLMFLLEARLTIDSQTTNHVLRPGLPVTVKAL